MNPSAPASTQTKYALPELERRFLLSAVPGEPTRCRRLDDRYLHGTRLRLRRAQEGDGEPVYKLTQKVPAPDGFPGLITTMYLDPTEYRFLAQLPADVLRKERLSVPPFVVDRFDGRLADLLIGEVEFGTRADMDAYEPPPEFVVREITGDPRLTGAALAAAGDSDADELIDLG